MPYVSLVHSPADHPAEATRRRRACDAFQICPDWGLGQMERMRGAHFLPLPPLPFLPFLPVGLPPAAAVRSAQRNGQVSDAAVPAASARGCVRTCVDFHAGNVGGVLAAHHGEDPVVELLCVSDI